jgi:uncharacterized protein
MKGSLEMAKPAPKYPAIDFHTHIENDGVRATLDLMDSVGLDGIVNLCSMDGPNGLSFKESIASFPDKDRKRIAFFTMINYEGIDERGWSEREANNIDLAVKAGATGLKELKRLGLGITDKAGNLIAVDDARLDPIWDRCGRLGIPVAIHVSDPLAFHQPLSLYNERLTELQAHPDWCFLKPGLPSKMELLEALSRVMSRHRRTQFVSVHVGGLAEDLVTVALWLEEHRNMHIDLAARFVEIGRHHPEMVRNFFIRYQDRIVFGTDTGISARSQMLGVPMNSDGDFLHREDYKEAFLYPYFRSMYRYLESSDYYIAPPTPIQGTWPIHGVHLPDAVLKKVYRENALRLVPSLREAECPFPHEDLAFAQ